jgi:outer membrane biosynthesis protein TonB
MDSGTLLTEQRLGLVAAIAVHAGLLALLVLNPVKAPEIAPPERMTVTLTDAVDVTSTSPEPMAQPQQETAPVIAEVPEPAPVPAPLPVVQPKPEPVAKPQPIAKVVPPLKPNPAPVVAPQPTPVARPVVSKPAPPAPSAAPATTARRIIPKPAGASRIGNDFLQGVPSAPAGVVSKNPPAAVAGPQVRASLAQSLLRQVRPNWQGRVPQGLNTDKIVTILSIELKADGTLAQRPTVLGQEGIDETNRAQAQRHAEEAIRAVQLSQPFDLPSDLYSAWKKLPPLRFRKSS